MEQRAPAQSLSRDQCTRGPSSRNNTNTIAIQVLLMYLFHTLYTHGTQVSHITGRSRPPGEVGLTPRQYTEWNVMGGVHTLYWRSLSVGAAA